MSTIANSKKVVSVGEILGKKSPTNIEDQIDTIRS